MDAPTNDSSLYGDLRDFRPPLRWVLVAARSVFAVCAVVGAITFVLHWILFFTAMHYAAPKPSGSQTFRMTDHGDTRYVSYPVHVCVKTLSIAMLIGLGVGIPGEMGLQWLIRRNKPRVGAVD